MTLASIPSPSQSVWHLGPFPLRAYALCIIAGVIAAVVISERRMKARGGPAGAIVDIAVWAVPFGIVGARIYHVLTSPQPYFGKDGHLIDALKIWNGGLGIWGAVAAGALGTWIACRRAGIPLTVVADVVAPGVAVAQAIGRFGNYFNQELFGKPTTLPWGLEIDPGRPGTTGAATYHPTFLYESLWCLGVAAMVIWAEKRFNLARGRVFALYVIGYVVGRAWIEALRIDEANHFLGVRLNDWTCLVVFIGAVAYFVTHKGPRERLIANEDGTVGVVYEGEPTTADESEAAEAAADAVPDSGPADADATVITDPDKTVVTKPAPAEAVAAAADPDETVVTDPDKTVVQDSADKH
ncbi:MAG: hypothetical protein QOJ50_143 [Cryptosporangiaceae bacterium]|nr:hypothetical protein [Cryptosporangiaceae bacterium]